MSDSSTWLTFTNLVLGGAVLAGCCSLGLGVWLEARSRRRKDAEIDREVADLLASFDAQDVRSPGPGGDVDRPRKRGKDTGEL